MHALVLPHNWHLLRIFVSVGSFTVSLPETVLSLVNISIGERGTSVSVTLPLLVAIPLIYSDVTLHHVVITYRRTVSCHRVKILE